MVVDELTIAIIGLCDGKHSIGEIAETVLADAALDDGTRHAVVERILELFEVGILRLCGVGGIS